MVSAGSYYPSGHTSNRIILLLNCCRLGVALHVEPYVPHGTYRDDDFNLGGMHVCPICLPNVTFDLYHMGVAEASKALKLWQLTHETTHTAGGLVCTSRSGQENIVIIIVRVNVWRW